jgi:hypothetical protein
LKFGLADIILRYMRYPKDIPEQQLINNVAKDFFGGYDATEIKGKIDFAVKPKKNSEEYFLWAEAKTAATDILVMLTQLVLTVGKAKTFDVFNPPHFLGCFDRVKIAFVPYYDVQEIFHQTDFNWNVTPSNRDTKEFKLVHGRIKAILTGEDTCIFNFAEDEKELKAFVKNNFVAGKDSVAKIQINKNNFKWVYDRWVVEVKPSIAVDWDDAKKSKIKDGAFYLADLLSENNKTLREKLFVLLKTDYYELDRKINRSGFLSSMRADFNDGQKAHTRFWAKYERPPKKEYWNYIVDRQDLLVPQDIREREGSFYTPKIWVELSQKYLADVFGEDWQDEYYIWDCAAGTGNLLAGLTNPRNIWASTLGKEDVAAMKTMGGLFENHVFQFDFLNDDFKKLPDGLRKIINDEKLRKRLIIYINPPYAEASNKRTLERGTRGNRGVEQSFVNKKYANLLGQGNAEIFAQFLTRTYCEIPGAILANFSTLKILCGPHFIDFRNFFLAKLKKAFVCPANTFDNVKGDFPIGFMIWDASKKEKFKKIVADVYNNNGKRIGKKAYFSYDGNNYINDWIKPFRGDKNDICVGKFPFKGNDFQNQNIIAIVNPETEYNVEAGQFLINAGNLIVACIYFAVRKAIPADWLNDRDQFLYPSDGWKTDMVFQNDCLAYTLFHGQNNISSKHGVNHWIPFAEEEISVHDSFDSHFMQSFIGGKIIQNGYSDLFEQKADKWCVKRKFSREASAVFAAGRELWRHYHRQPRADVNASLYDIREHFQGRNGNGKMNSKSADETYSRLIGVLREKLKILAEKIEPNVYEYGFLKG